MHEPDWIAQIAQEAELEAEENSTYPAPARPSWMPGPEPVETIVPVIAPRREANPATSQNLGDKIFDGILSVAGVTIFLVLALVVGVLVVQGREAIVRFGTTFFVSATWDPIHNIYGAAPAILGTIYTSLLALLFAAPVGILVAIFLVEIAPRPVRSPLGFTVELLAAVPSVVFGLWALYVLSPFVAHTIETPVMAHFGTFFLFQGYPVGLGVLTASLILSVMILPTITAISRDVLVAIPNSQREGMLALGATRWETIWHAVLPVARSGIIGAITLGLGRAVGETMAVQMVIGNTQDFHLSLFSFGTTMPATIVNQFTEATGDLYRSALIEIALILMIITFALNGLARLLVWRTTR